MRGAFLVVASLAPLAVGAAGCVFPERQLDGLACDGQGLCVEGYTCVEGTCVRDEDVPPPGPQPNDAGPNVLDDAGSDRLDDAGPDRLDDAGPDLLDDAGPGDAGPGDAG